MWQNTKRLTQDGSLMELANKVRKKVGLDDTPIFDENVAEYAEWSSGSIEYRGTRNTSGQRHGIVRKIDTASGGAIVEASFKNGSEHGLRLVWYPSGSFVAQIYQDGDLKGLIGWDKNWSEFDSYNKAYCLEFFSIADFKP